MMRFDLTVRDYYKLNITLNSTVLKANGIFNFFVKDEDVVNSTEFTTVQPATASFSLDTTSFEPITGILNLTVINFNGSGIFPFNYEFYVESSLDPKTLFLSGFANITTLTNYVILFSVPFTQENTNIKLTVRLFTLYSEVTYIDFLNSTSSAAGSAASKLEVIDSNIASATTDNISVLVNSFKMTVGQRYVSAPLTNPCSTCGHGICTTFKNNSMQCKCDDFYHGRYCTYESTIWNKVISIQDKLTKFLRNNGQRRLLASSLTTLSRLQIMLSVVTYPDALTASQLVILQNTLDRVTTVGSFDEADMYVQIVSYLAAASDALAVDNIEYLRNKLVVAGDFMKNYLTQTSYYRYQNNIEFKVINSDYFFKNTLMNSSVPLLNFTMALWKVNFYYRLLMSNTYMSTLYPYALAMFLPNSSWYYFEVGNDQKVNISIQLPVIFLDANQSALY
jgi:hypothetical protein